MKRNIGKPREIYEESFFVVQCMFVGTCNWSR